MLGGLGGGASLFFLLILAAGRWETAFDFWLLLLRSALRNGFGEKREGRRPGFNRGGSMGGLGGGKGGVGTVWIERETRCMGAPLITALIKR